MVRAQCVRPCRLAAPIGADLHWPPNGCTACARTLHAFCTGFSWVDSAHATESTHLIGTVVPCRRQPWTVHALGRLSAIASGEKSTYCSLYLLPKAAQGHQGSLRPRSLARPLHAGPAAFSRARARDATRRSRAAQRTRTQRTRSHSMLRTLLFAPF